MITNFEEITQPITDSEKRIAPIVLEIIKRFTKEKPIISEHLQAEVHHNPAVDVNVTHARLRAIIHHLRCQENQPIIGTSRGYFYTTDIEEIRKQRTSLMERAMSIMEVAASFDRMETELFRPDCDTPLI